MARKNCFLIKEESNYNTMIDFLFKDADIQSYTEHLHSKILSYLNKRTVQKVLSWCINPLTKKRYGIYRFFENINLDDEKKYIIFLNSSFITSHYPPQVMNYYKKRWPNMVFVLLYIDVVDHPVSRHANLLREKKVFDLIYTVDKDDAEKYSMTFIRTPYSLVRTFKEESIKKDIYFCGVTKDRGNTILDIIDAAEQNQVNVSMDIFCNESERKEFVKRECVNILDEYVSYTGLLKKTLEANCILDLVQGGQAALSLRPYEAVVYNRKLLTNNKSILEFDFYDTKYMRYFSSVEEIDWEWVTEKCGVDYEYSGQFSPLEFIKRIMKDEENR